MLLTRVLDSYLRSHDLAQGSAAHLRYVLGRFAREVGRNIGDLTDDNLNAWIESLLAGGMARATVKGYRGAVITVWRHAAHEMATRPPSKVRPVRLPRQIPTAWTCAEVWRLLAACDHVDGSFRFYRLTYAEYLRALVLVGWDTGLRLGDILKIRREHIGVDGTLALVQNKTGTPIICRLRPETMGALRKLPSKMFGVIGRGRVFELFGDLKRHAGLNGHDKTKGLRKAGATAIEAAFPGRAGVYLGHLTSGLALKHYVDPRHLQAAMPQTPRLRAAPSDRQRGGRRKRA